MPKICEKLNRNRNCKKCNDSFVVRWDDSPQVFCSRLCAKEETYKKISNSQKGKARLWQIGKKRTPSTREKMSATHTGQRVLEATKKLMSEAKLGKHHAHGYKISLTLKGRPKSPEHIEAAVKPRRGVKSSIFGDKHWNWKGGITSISEQVRKSMEYRQWRKKVFERDKYTCQMCGQVGGDLNADHIKPFAYFPELRLEITNGRTLCVPCHKVTDTFGYGSVRLFASSLIHHININI